MDPWTQVLDRIWYYLEQGANSAGIVAEFPVANRYKYGADQLDALPPANISQSVLIVDQAGGKLDINYSPRYLLAKEEFQIAIWSDSLELAKVNDLRVKVFAAIDAGLPDLGLSNVLDIGFHTGRVTLALDKVEQDADGRLMQWRSDLRKSRQRAVLLEMNVSFLIDRDALSN